MKIVFVAREMESTAIEHLAAVLKQDGHIVSLAFDPSLFISFYFQHNPLARFFSYSKIVVDEIEDVKPDLVAFSVLSDDLSWALDLARKIKSRMAVPVVFGGIHPTSVPEHVIKENGVDFVCVGEGEYPLRELAVAIEQGEGQTCIWNIWAKEGGRIVKNPVRELIENLDALPLPDKDIFYKKHPVFYDQAYKILTARGCPHACSYCYNSYFRKAFYGKGKYLRRRSVGSVIEELILAKEKYRMKRVTFLDDTFIYDQRWLEDFLEQYQANIKLSFMCTVYPSLVNKKVVRLLRNAGCTVINMGIQDINENLRASVLNRHDSNRDIRRAIRLIKKSRIFIYTTIILGLPQQDESDVVATVRFLNENRPDIPDSNWLRYYPKTVITEFSFKQGLLHADEIKGIDQSYAFRPYGLGGHAFSQNLLKLRNLLFLTCILPKELIVKILDGKTFYLLPSVDLRSFELVIVFLKNIFLNGRRNIYPVMTPFNIFSFYGYFMGRKFFLRLRKIFNRR